MSPITDEMLALAEAKCLQHALEMLTEQDPDLPPISLGAAAIQQDRGGVISAQFEAEKFNLDHFAGEYDHQEGEINEEE